MISKESWQQAPDSQVLKACLVMWDTWMQIHAHSYFCLHHDKLLGGQLRDWVSLGVLSQLEQIPFRCYWQWFEGGVCTAC